MPNSHRINRRTMLGTTIGLVPAFMVSAVQSQAADTPADNIDVTIAKIVKARDYTAQFVVLAKQQLKQGSPEYNQAFKLYASAYSDYGAWNAFVASALASGRIKTKKPLPNDPQYDTLSSTAIKSSTAFTSYVDAKTQGETKAIEAAVAAIADLGIKLWTQISAKNAQDRAAAAKRFSDATVWQTWAQVTDGSSPLPKESSPDTASPKKPTSTTTDTTQTTPPAETKKKK